MIIQIVVFLFFIPATNALWNNMFEAPTAKKTNWQREFANVRCPTEQMPFIYTNKNQQLA